MKNVELTHDVLKTFADFDGHEKVVHVTDEATGLNAFIAVHNTNIGPALGGCRIVRYASERDALHDVLRLSRGMTYKNALAGLPLGGGKSVIIANPHKDKTPDMMRAMGAAVHALGGAYITAEDSGSSEKDMEIIATQTPYVVGMHAAAGSLGGNPSPVTAWGVYNGLRAAVKHRHNAEALAGLRVAVQGLGAVGYELCRLLHNDGVKLTATDVRESVLAQAQKDFPGIQTTAPADIFSAEADVFAPCALGAQINAETIPLLRAGIIAGAANNQMATPGDHAALARRGILYVPDYVINAGGVISAGYEYFNASGFNPYQLRLTREAMMEHVGRIGPTVTKVLNIAVSRGVMPAQAADEMAEAVFRTVPGAANGQRAG